jgi:hypothetical protein
VPNWRRLYRSGRAPKPLKIGARKNGWRLSALIEFLAEKSRQAATETAAESDAPPMLEAYAKKVIRPRSTAKRRQAMLESDAPEAYAEQAVSRPARSTCERARAKAEPRRGA